MLAPPSGTRTPGWARARWPRATAFQTRRISGRCGARGARTPTPGARTTSSAPSRSRSAARWLRAPPRPARRARGGRGTPRRPRRDRPRQSSRRGSRSPRSRSRPRGQRSVRCGEGARGREARAPPRRPVRQHEVEEGPDHHGREDDSQRHRRAAGQRCRQGGSPGERLKRQGRQMRERRDPHQDPRVGRSERRERWTNRAARRPT